MIKHKSFECREEFDRAMDAALTDAGVEIVCLAGFMRLLSGDASLFTVFFGKLLMWQAFVLIQFPTRY